MANKAVFSRVDLAREMAKRRPDLHEDQAIGIIDLALAIIVERVKADERVSLRGFGTFFKGQSRAVPAGFAFPGRAPLEVGIPAKARISFTQSRVLKATIPKPKGRKQKSKP